MIGKEVCATCKYCRVRDPRRPPPIYECRRSPPVVTQGHDGWPRVSQEDWCGEWEERK